MKELLLILTCVFVTGNGIPAQTVINGDFEQGRGVGWVEGSQYTIIGTSNFFASNEIQPAVIPRSGNWMARVGGYAYNVDSLYQAVTLPNTKPLYVGFSIQTRSSTTSECAGLWVGAKISVIINDEVISEAYLCNYNDLLNWTRYFVDLSAIAGTSATIKFKAEAANSVWSYLYIDDVNLTNTTAVEDHQNTNLPAVVHLEQNFPNPFNPSTVIRYQLPTETFVTLKILNALGQVVAVLVNEEQEFGNKSVSFSAAHLPSGVYYYVLLAGKDRRQGKMMLVK